MKLTDAQHKWLTWLAENGGEGSVQGQGIVAIKTRQKASTASAICFLHLVSQGAAFLRGGRLTLTDYGYRLLGRTPPAARPDSEVLQAVPQLADKKAVVLYFETDEGRDEVVAAIQAMQPNMRAVNL